jgi:5,10-methylenetetrahydromethanopterin reductase
MVKFQHLHEEIRVMTTQKNSGAEQLFDKFGTYILPGRVTDPQRGIEEATEAERIGLGAVWISERYATKEPAVLAGAVSQITDKVRIAGTMYVTMRHPIVTASVANLMQQLTGDRFRLLLAKAVPEYLASLGSAPIVFKRLADSISIYRRLWAGETVSYDGILGKFPNLALTDLYEGPPPPIIFTAIGPKSLAFAGEHCDGVLLHPFITAQGVTNSVKIVRQAAEQAGRAPDAVRIYHNIIVAPDLPKDIEEAVVGGRAITYFQTPGFGEIITQINGWDNAVLDAIRSHPQMQNMKGENADQAFTREQLVEVSRVLPQQWLDDGAAVGTAAQCAAKLCGFLDAGADEILLHGSSPAAMGPLTEELRKALA